MAERNPQRLSKEESVTVGSSKDRVLSRLASVEEDVLVCSSEPLVQVKHQGWLFSFDDVHSIWQKLDQWMAAVALTPIWGIDRSTFSQLLVDLDLPDEDLKTFIIQDLYIKRI